MNTYIVIFKQSGIKKLGAIIPDASNKAEATELAISNYGNQVLKVISQTELNYSIELIPFGQKLPEQQDIIDSISSWFNIASPNPTNTDVNSQFRCILEEVSELVSAIPEHSTTFTLVGSLINFSPKIDKYVLDKNSRLEIADALGDIMVTVIGLANYLNMDIKNILTEVNRSNYSKLNSDGKLLKNELGKIIKPSHYSEPDLSKYI